MRPLPPKLVKAHAKAVALVQSTASIDDRWTMPRYKAVLAAAYLQADDLAAKKGGSMEDWLAKRLGSPIAQKAVKAIDTEGARRGWPPGLLDLPPVASRALSTATAPTVPSTAAPGDVMHTQVGESIWSTGANTDLPAPMLSDGLEGTAPGVTDTGEEALDDGSSEPGSVTGFLRANWPWFAGAGVVAFLVRR